jgi:hypothetical protein
MVLFDGLGPIIHSSCLRCGSGQLSLSPLPAISARQRRNLLPLPLHSSTESALDTVVTSINKISDGMQRPVSLDNGTIDFQVQLYSDQLNISTYVFGDDRSQDVFAQ